MDWAYPSNRFVLLATPFVGAIAGVVALIRGETLLDAVGWGFSAGGVSFLAWTIGRELHPDRAWIAALATLIAPVGLFWGRGDLLTTATILLVARAVAGTTGRALRPSDVLLMAAVGLPIIVRDAGPAALAVGAVGLAVAAIWHDRRRGVAIAAAGLYAAAAVAALYVADPPGLPGGDVWALFWVGVVAGVVTLVGPGSMTTVEDRRDGDVLRSTRVRAARFVALLTAACVSLTAGPALVGPVWAALVATALRPR
jgi:hypothetical protein